MNSSVMLRDKYTLNQVEVEGVPLEQNKKVFEDYIKVSPFVTW